MKHEHTRRRVLQAGLASSAMLAVARSAAATRATMRFDNESRILNHPHAELRKVLA
jgi:hypothetical protein